MEGGEGRSNTNRVWGREMDFKSSKKSCVICLLQESLVQGVSSRRRERLAAENLHDLQLLSPHVVVSAIDRLLFTI
jgi:hypothetical protein